VIAFIMSIITFLLHNTAVLVFGGMVIGARAPDIDLAPVLFLRHRSGWTHGPLMPLAVMWAAGRWPSWEPALIGLLLGLFVHLLADTFPRKWSGAALVSFHPLAFTLPPLASSLYIASAAVVSGAAAMQLAGLLA
jgi:membrane-bound metal-dependent hydrolase YbcI (DUF457 family)